MMKNVECTKCTNQTTCFINVRHFFLSLFLKPPTQVHRCTNLADGTWSQCLWMTQNRLLDKGRQHNERDNFSCRPPKIIATPCLQAQFKPTYRPAYLSLAPVKYSLTILFMGLVEGTMWRLRERNEWMKNDNMVSVFWMNNSPIH